MASAEGWSFLCSRTGTEAVKSRTTAPRVFMTSIFEQRRFGLGYVKSYEPGYTI